MIKCDICNKNLKGPSQYTNHFKSCSKINHNYFKDVNDEKAWLIGLIAADGCIKNNCWSICQSGDNGKSILEYIKKILNYERGLTSYFPERGKIVYTLNIPSIIMVNDLYKFGLMKQKTLKLNLIYLDSNFMKSFLRGYFEGDGCICVSRSSNIEEYLAISFVGNFNFINFILNSIPISGYTFHDYANVREIRFSGQKAIQFYSWLFNNHNLFYSYKQKIFDNYIQTAKEPTWSINNKKKKIFFSELSKNSNILEISKICNIPFQTCYKWLKKEKKEYYSLGNFLIEKYI